MLNKGAFLELLELLCYDLIQLQESDSADANDCTMIYSSGYENSDCESYCQELSAQQQWEESMNQLSTLATFVFLPLIGKLLGRRFSFMIYRNVSERIWAQSVR